jgi:hypothetical protein
MVTSNFSLGLSAGPGANAAVEPCRNFQTPQLSNDRLKFKRMFQAEARKFDHVSSL